MNADKTIYGRFGSRSSVDNAEKEMTTAGLAASMDAVLKLHRDYPGNKNQLRGKQPVEVEFKTPDDYPSLRGKFNDKLDYDGAVTRSCMHCHQVRDAEREIYRNAGKPIPNKLLFPNPAPATVGFHLDPNTRSTVSKVDAGSAAMQAGLRKGDQLLSLDGQPIVSHADVQWVLHHADEEDELIATVARAGKSQQLTLKLDEGWRRDTDISWRVSSWPLRRMGTGGLLFEMASEEQRRRAGVEGDGLALAVKHVGQYGAHGAAKRAGFRKGDIVVSFDGQDENLTTSQLLAYTAQQTKPGQKIPGRCVPKREADDVNAANAEIENGR